MQDCIAILPQSTVVVPCAFCFLFTDDSHSRADEKEEMDKHLHTHTKHFANLGFPLEQRDAKAVPNFVNM